MERFVAIGEIVNTVGLRGEVKLYPLIDFWGDLLGSDFMVWDDGSPAPVVRHRPAGSCEALTLEGVGDRNAAERFVGRKLGFLRESYAAPDFPKPAGGLPFRWVGRPVVTTGGDAVGTVTEVRFTGGGFMLVIEVTGQPGSEPGAGPGSEILVPAVDPILRPEDDLEGDLVIDPPEGLLDVQSK